MRTLRSSELEKKKFFQQQEIREIASDNRRRKLPISRLNFDGNFSSAASSLSARTRFNKRKVVEFRIYELFRIDHIILNSCIEERDAVTKRRDLRIRGAESVKLATETRSEDFLRKIIIDHHRKLKRRVQSKLYVIVF